MMLATTSLTLRVCISMLRASAEGEALREWSEEAAATCSTPSK